MIALVFASLTCCGITTEQLDDLNAYIEITPTELRLGDVVFARVWLTNQGKEPAILKWNRYERTTGSLSLQLDDHRRQTSFTLRPPSMGDLGGGTGGFQIEPGEKWLVGHERLKMPPLRCVEWPFWDAKKLSESPYTLSGWLALRRGGKVRVGMPDVTIRPRPEKEMATLLEYYNGGRESGVLPGWDLHRPWLAIFHLGSFPRICSLPAELAKMEEILSPGSLRDIVQATRLAAEVYDAETLEKRRLAMTELLRWLDQRPEIQRHIMATDLVSWTSGNKGLGEYLFEFVDQLIPRLPKDSQQQLRTTNSNSRERYLKSVREREEPVAPYVPPEMSYTVEQIKLVNRIIRYEGRVWFPGEGSYLLGGSEPKGDKAGFRVRLEGASLAMIPITDLRKLENVEFLHLKGSEVTDELLKHVATLPGIRVLDLRETPVSDAGLQHLQKLGSLENLYLEDTEIGDRGLQYLKGLTELRYLSLSSTKISDVGLRYLEDMKNLESLRVGGTKVTQEGIARLKQALPKLEIRR